VKRGIKRRWNQAINIVAPAGQRVIAALIGVTIFSFLPQLIILSPDTP
jgi:hypothetical protein